FHWTLGFIGHFQKPGHVTPVDYTKLNALYDQFVPQKEFSREQVYWLSASDIASQSGDPPKPVTPFVHTRPMNSKVHTKVWKIKECLTPFEEVIKKRTAPPSNVLYHRVSLEKSNKNVFGHQISRFYQSKSV
nr:hypothetical protein [Tanacetum cinerariifolium]